MIVGITVSCIDTDTECVQYQVHSLAGAEDRFYFYGVKDSKIIKD